MTGHNKVSSINQLVNSILMIDILCAYFDFFVVTKVLNCDFIVSQFEI